MADPCIESSTSVALSMNGTNLHADAIVSPAAGNLAAIHTAPGDTGLYVAKAGGVAEGGVQAFDGTSHGPFNDPFAHVFAESVLGVPGRSDYPTLVAFNATFDPAQIFCVDAASFFEVRCELSVVGIGISGTDVRHDQRPSNGGVASIGGGVVEGVILIPPSSPPIASIWTVHIVVTRLISAGNPYSVTPMGYTVNWQAIA